MKYKLDHGGWHDDYESLIYFDIRDENGKSVWQSSWMDVRDLCDKEWKEDFVESVNNACLKYGLNPIIDCEDEWEWEDVANDTSPK